MGCPPLWEWPVGSDPSNFPQIQERPASQSASTMFERVLIANRGAIASRIVRTCRELNLHSVCCYSDIDSDLPAIDEADEAVRLPGYKAEDTYLNADQVLQAAAHCGAEAIHPGYGFLAESSKFAKQVAEAGLVFVGPSPKWIEDMSEKTHARSTMQNLGFPVHQGSGVVQTADDVRAFIDQVDLPILLKPARGGGGIGMMVVEHEDELRHKLMLARELATRAFSDDSLYAEKYLAKPQHIEFQIIGDGANCVSLGARDCSVQRRHQKLLEETPVPRISQQELNDLSDTLVNAIRGYDSVGTVECLYADGEFGFLEMNTRLQVEHGVTEEAHSVDLVAAQLQIAQGRKLSEIDLGSSNPTSYAVEARLYAEDSVQMLPSSGCLAAFQPVNFEGVRIDVAYRAGNHVTPYYDPLLAKIIGTGSSREQAIARTAIALKAFEVSGVSTNSTLLQSILGSEAFILGRVHTDLVSQLHSSNALRN